MDRKNYAIGLISEAGRYGGTYAHKDIAFKFASWISVEFELYLIKEFQRLKIVEQQAIEWSAKRELAKVNYHIHTDAIKENIVPTLTEEQLKYVYADEADLLNVALFGKRRRSGEKQILLLAIQQSNTASLRSISCALLTHSVALTYIQYAFSTQ
ncbi:MAG: KilA-N domain-containing protein [Corallococcus sp.]|nr:KilA-N domain-containing protein [Corallococcus sp.]